MDAPTPRCIITGRLAAKTSQVPWTFYPNRRHVPSRTARKLGRPIWQDPMEYGRELG